jgi:hypothetical protein
MVELQKLVDETGLPDIMLDLILRARRAFALLSFRTLGAGDFLRSVMGCLGDVSASRSLPANIARSTRSPVFAHVARTAPSGVLQANPVSP